jgi:hypothetical protein
MSAVETEEASYPTAALFLAYFSDSPPGSAVNVTRPVFDGLDKEGLSRGRNSTSSKSR